MRVYLKKIMTGALIALFMVPTSLMMAPQQSDALTATIAEYSVGPIVSALACLYGGAIAGAIADIAISTIGTLFGGGAVAALLGGAEVPTINRTINYRECILDALAWELINAIIRAVTDDMVAWIESGFQDGPVFMTDYRGFFLETGDRIAGRFIQEHLEFVCSPFRLNLQLSLASTRGARTGAPDQFQCRLSEVIDNIDGFLAGDFMAGNWEGFFTMAANRASNPINAVLDAQYAMEALIVNDQGQQIDLLEWGRGFFSIPTEGEYEIIGNPGAVLEAQINNTFDNTNRRLVAADEINEVLSALAGYFINEVILGNSTGIATGGRSYLATAQANTMSALRDNLLTEADALIAEREAAGDAEGAARLRVVRDEIAGLDMTNPEDVSRLQGLRARLTSTYVEVLNGPAAGAGGGTGGNPSILPPPSAAPGLPPTNPDGSATPGAGDALPPPPPPPPPPAGGGAGGGDGTGGGGGGAGAGAGTPPPPPPPPPPIP